MTKRFKVLIILGVIIAMKVPEPKWSGMILRCDDQNKNCYWTCEWGYITVPETIDGNEVNISSGCVKDKPQLICPNNCTQFGIMPS